MRPILGFKLNLISVLAIGLTTYPIHFAQAEDKLQSTPIRIVVNQVADGDTEYIFTTQANGQVDLTVKTFALMPPVLLSEYHFKNVTDLVFPSGATSFTYGPRGEKLGVRNVKEQDFPVNFTTNNSTNPTILTLNQVSVIAEKSLYQMPRPKPDAKHQGLYLTSSINMVRLDGQYWAVVSLQYTSPDLEGIWLIKPNSDYSKKIAEGYRDLRIDMLTIEQHIIIPGLDPIPINPRTTYRAPITIEDPLTNAPASEPAEVNLDNLFAKADKETLVALLNTGGLFAHDEKEGANDLTNLDRSANLSWDIQLIELYLDQHPSPIEVSVLRKKLRTKEFDFSTTVNHTEQMDILAQLLVYELTDSSNDLEEPSQSLEKIASVLTSESEDEVHKKKSIPNIVFKEYGVAAILKILPHLKTLLTKNSSAQNDISQSDAIADIMSLLKNHPETLMIATQYLYKKPTIRCSQLF